MATSENNRPFLTATWDYLINLTYEVDYHFLRMSLPPFLEPDLYKKKAFVSLVAFRFRNTKVLGMKIPFHVNFPEINLRAYVKANGKRGVFFFREFVPRCAISAVANVLYNEPYKTAPMNVQWQNLGTKNLIAYTLGKNERFRISAEFSEKLGYPPANSSAHFFKEHEWGFGKRRNHTPLLYQVEHPVWAVHADAKFSLSWDFGEIYGPAWKFLNHASPAYKLLAHGSGVKVFSAREMKQ